MQHRWPEVQRQLKLKHKWQLLCGVLSVPHQYMYWLYNKVEVFTWHTQPSATGQPRLCIPTDTKLYTWLVPWGIATYILSNRRVTVASPREQRKVREVDPSRASCNDCSSQSDGTYTNQQLWIVPGLTSVVPISEKSPSWTSLLFQPARCYNY